ncbi:MAG: DoxX family membrane protein [Flavobacteriaceae bacterium]|nr:DoxX family membrane protein [Flavobacteriaceae bacterium]
MLPWHQYLLGILFIVAGFFHLQKPKIYEKIMPPYIPSHKSMVLISGIVEMILGFMILNPVTQKLSAWGIIILLVLFLPIHVYMLQEKEASLKLPKWVLILRFPLQFLLVYWAFQYV